MRLVSNEHDRSIPRVIGIRMENMFLKVVLDDIMDSLDRRTLILFLDDDKVGLSDPRLSVS